MLIAISGLLGIGPRLRDVPHDVVSGGGPAAGNAATRTFLAPPVRRTPLGSHRGPVLRVVHFDCMLAKSGSANSANRVVRPLAPRRFRAVSRLLSGVEPGRAVLEGHRVKKMVPFRAACPGLFSTNLGGGQACVNNRLSFGAPPSRLVIGVKMGNCEHVQW